MKYAVISVSREGALLGQRVKDGISGEGTLYERKGAESGGEAVYFNRTLALTSDIFTKYDASSLSWPPALWCGPWLPMW